MVAVSFTSLLCISTIFENVLRLSVVFAYLSLRDQILDMKTGPKPIGRLLIQGRVTGSMPRMRNSMPRPKEMNLFAITKDFSMR